MPTNQCLRDLDHKAQGHDAPKCELTHERKCTIIGGFIYVGVSRPLYILRVGDDVLPLLLVTFTVALY